MNIVRTILLVSLMCAVIKSGAAAQNTNFPGSRGSFTAENFAARRATLATAIPHSLVVLFGSKSLMDTWEEQRYNASWHIEGFRQDETLFYLSGFDAPSAVAIFDTDTDVMQFYAPAVTPAIAEETQRLRLSAAKSMEQFEPDLEKAASDRPVYILARENGVQGPSGGFLVQGTAVGTYSRFLPGGASGTYREDVIKTAMQARYPHVEFRSLVPIIREQRKYLDAQEIAAMRKAVTISVDALSAGIRAIKPGVRDIQIGAVMECTMRMNGSQRRAYAPDIQSGPNIPLWYTELFDQYDMGNRVMRAGELALIDQGAEYSYYQADLARDIPVSGHYTDEQRLLYHAFQKAYEAGLAAFAPGTSFLQVGAAASKAMLAQIPGLPEWARPTALQFAQTTKLGPPGHFLSTTLDLHRDAHLPLKPGQVMAFEIHWFMPERNWRFTLEDDVLITAAGHEVLSEALPRSPEALEKLMAQGGPLGCSAPPNPVALQ